MKITNNTYTDGAETQLLQFFTSKPSYTQSDIRNFLIKNNHNWSLLYHLSPQRHFLLSWYDFKPNSSILEIGAGCGALTGLFLEKAKKVVANELEDIRAKVIRARFSKHNNLSVNSQSIAEFKCNEKFDYVAVIGVLEYAGAFFHQSNSSHLNPHLEFLNKAKSFLKKGGKLLLAIENRIGLKYFTGHPEDHTGALYDSLNNYASQSKIKTFSKSELTDLLHKSGFIKLNFNYPFPDYKLPFSIFTEEGMSQKLNLSVAELAHSPSRGHQHIPMINEAILTMTLNEENLLPNFANSFLVEATVS